MPTEPGGQQDSLPTLSKMGVEAVAIGAKMLWRPIVTFAISATAQAARLAKNS